MCDASLIVAASSLYASALSRVVLSLVLNRVQGDGKYSSAFVLVGELAVRASVHCDNMGIGREKVDSME